MAYGRLQRDGVLMVRYTVELCRAIEMLSMELVVSALSAQVHLSGSKGQLYQKYILS